MGGDKEEEARSWSKLHHSTEYGDPKRVAVYLVLGGEKRTEGLLDKSGGGGRSEYN